MRGDTLVFGLPGNPVSSLVGFELFVRPRCARCRARAIPGPRTCPAGSPRACAATRTATSSCARGATASCSSRVGGQDSHMIVRAAAADALVLVPRGEGELAAGAPVSYLRI